MELTVSDIQDMYMNVTCALSDNCDFFGDRFTLKVLLRKQIVISPESQNQLKILYDPKPLQN